MKRLDSVETEKIQLEVIECDCGFHIGLDATYLIQVGDFIIECPVCGTQIYTKEVCPENKKHITQTLTQPSIPKLLAQYLDEYIEHEYNEGNIGEDVGVLYAWDSWRELLEQALDAYESTENVMVQIIKKKAR
jgi:hypothetical protein